MTLPMNCKVTVLRGSRTEDEYLDEVDVPHPVATGVPASIREWAVTTRNQQVIVDRDKRGVARLPYGVDIRVMDRLVVEGTGETYQVRSIQQRHLPFGGIKAEIIKVSGRV